MTHCWSISDVLPPPLSNYEDTIRTDRMTPARAPNGVQIVDRRVPERAGDGLSQVTETNTNPAFPCGKARCVRGSGRTQ